MGMRKSKSTAPPDTSSASRWGREGRWFESSRPDTKPPLTAGVLCVWGRAVCQGRLKTDPPPVSPRASTEAGGDSDAVGGLGAVAPVGLVVVSRAVRFPRGSLRPQLDADG